MDDLKFDIQGWSLPVYLHTGCNLSITWPIVLHDLTIQKITQTIEFEDDELKIRFDPELKDTIVNGQGNFLGLEEVKQLVTEKFSRDELNELYKFLYNSHNCRIR